MKNFLFQYRRAKPSNPKITVERYLSCDAAEILESQGIDIKDDEKIMKYFDEYVKERKMEDSNFVLEEFANKLKWPKSKNLSAIDQIDKFFQQAKLLNDKLKLRKDLPEDVNKRVAQLVVRAMPKAFGINTNHLYIREDYRKLDKLKELAMERRFVIERKTKYKPSKSDASESEGASSRTENSEKTARTTKSKKKGKKNKRNIKAKNVKASGDKSDTSKKIEELEKLVKQLLQEKTETANQKSQPAPWNNNSNQMNRGGFRGGPRQWQPYTRARGRGRGGNQLGYQGYQRFNRNFNPMPYNANNVREANVESQEEAVLRVRKVSTNYVTIQISPTRSSWTAVRGCLDSGCDKTVGSYKLLQHLCNNLQPPHTVRMLELPQGTQVPVKAVGRSHLRILMQGEEPFDFGATLIFLVDDPKWEDVLIGRDTLGRFNLLPEQQLENRKANDEKPQE